MAVTKTISVLGGGSFGSAIANIIATNGYSVYLWFRDAKKAEYTAKTRENLDYLPGVILNENIIATADLFKAVRCSDIIFVSIPSRSFRTVVDQFRPMIKPNTMLVSTTKGIEVERFLLMSQILAQELPGHPIGVLSGPNLAKEIIAKQLTGSVIASLDEEVQKQVQEILRCEYFRVYNNSDVFGVELGGALKNIYGIASGMCDALQLGRNTGAMLMTRSLAEMSRFAVTLGANPMTFLGLAGVGDLIVTCMSPLSRNYQVGYALGQGRSLDEILEHLGQVAEGVNTLKAIYFKSQEMQIYMPLVAGLYRVLFEGKKPREIAKGLMLTEEKSDVEFKFNQ